MLGIVFIYLFLVAYGRTYLGIQEDSSYVNFFKHGVGRFHYFWITILFPWIVYMSVSQLVPIRNKMYLLFILVVPSMFLFVQFDRILPYYKESFIVKSQGKDCIYASLKNKSEGINCPTLFPRDLSPAIKNMMEHYDTTLNYMLKD